VIKSKYAFPSQPLLEGLKIIVKIIVLTLNTSKKEKMFPVGANVNKVNFSLKLNQAKIIKVILV
jgi:hypothetical protein